MSVKMIRLEIFVVLANCSLNEFLVGSCIKGKHLFVPNLKSFCKLKIFFSSNFKLTENLLATVNYDCFNKFLGFFLFFFFGGGGGGGKLIDLHVTTNLSCLQTNC